MNAKILNTCLILFSLFGYLEWGKDKQMFLLQGEAEILLKLVTNPLSVAHPFILLPLIGQLILLYTLFQKTPSRTLTFLGLGGIGTLLVLMFIIGLISFRFKILLSTLPFLITGILTLKYHQKTKPKA